MVNHSESIIRNLSLNKKMSGRGVHKGWKAKRRYRRKGEKFFADWLIDLSAEFSNLAWTSRRKDDSVPYLKVHSKVVERQTVGAMQTCQSLLDCVIARATAQLPSYTHRLGQTSAGKDDGRKKALRNGKVRVGRLMLGQVTARGASLSSLGSRLGGRESVASLSCSSEEDDADATF